MAEEIVFKTRVDTGNSAKDIDNLQKSLKGVDQGTKASNKELHNLSATFEDIYGDLKPLSGRLGELEDRMYELALAGKTNTDEFKALQAETVKYRQTIIEVDKSVDQLAEQGKLLGNALQIGSTVAAGYGIVQGSMAAMGVESEELEETLVKLTAVNSVLNGLEQIQLQLRTRSIVVTKAQAAGQAILSAAQAGYTAVVGTSTGALKAFRIALISTGIGAIIVGIGLLIANFDKLTGWVEKAITNFRELGTGIKIAIAVMIPIVGVIWGIIEALEYFGVIEEQNAKVVNQAAEAIKKKKREILREQQDLVNGEIEENKKLQKSITETYDWEIEKARAAGKDVAEIEKAKREEMRKTLLEQISNLEQAFQLNRTNANEMLRITQQLAAARAAVLQTEKEDELQSIRETAEAQKSAADKRKEQDQIEEQLAAQKKERERLLKDFIIANFDDENVQRLTKLQEQHNREREDLVEKYGQDTELLKQLETKQENELQLVKKDIEAKEKEKKTQKKILEQEQAYIDRKAQLEGELILMREDWEAKQALEAELAILERDIALQDENLTEGEKFKIKQEYQQRVDELKQQSAEREKEINQQIADAQVEVQGMAFNAIGALSNAFFDLKSDNLEKGSKEELENAKKQFEINKSLQIVQAVISGVQGVQAAFSSGAAVPVVGAVLGPVYAALAAGVAVANVAQISRQKFNGGGSGGSTSVSAPSPAASPTVGAPSIPDVGGSATTTQTGGLPEGGGGQNGVKVSVVDSDIKAGLDNQEKVSVISSFG